MHALTIDVEDWYHVENMTPVAPPETWDGLEARLPANMARLLDLFDRHGVKSTCFVLGKAAERHPDVVREIVRRGHELACHGWSHELIYRQTPEVFRAETRRAKAFLEDLGGVAVHGYRASTFSITERTLWALDILSTMRAFGREFPLGGGFFRLFPLRWTERAVARHAAAGRSAGLYLHPWEIDPGQPRVGGLSLMNRFRHYARLAATEGKLDRLLARATRDSG